MSDVVLESIQLDLLRDIPEEIEHLNRENKNIKYLLVGIFIVVSIAGIVHYRKKTKENELREQYKIK